MIFFDGYCGLCNGFVDFMLKVDRNKIFQFSPLQSEFAKQTLKSSDTQDLKSVVVFIHGETFRKAPAVLRVFKELGGFWAWLSLLSFLPEAFLNFCYDVIAENRYKLFGKRETCRIPTPEEKARFIL